MIFFSNNIHQFVNKKTVGTSKTTILNHLQNGFLLKWHPKCPAKCSIPLNTTFRAHLPPCVSCLDVTKDDPLIAPCQCKGSIECPRGTERFFGRRNQFDGEMNMVCIFQQKELKGAPFVEKPKDFRVFRTS